VVLGTTTVHLLPLLGEDGVHADLLLPPVLLVLLQGDVVRPVPGPLGPGLLLHAAGLSLPIPTAEVPCIPL